MVLVVDKGSIVFDNPQCTVEGGVSIRGLCFQMNMLIMSMNMGTVAAVHCRWH